MTFTVRVEYTDRTIVGQAFRTLPTTVHVEADDEVEATLVAAQMAAAIRCNLDGMVIGTSITSVEI